MLLTIYVDDDRPPVALDFFLLGMGIDFDCQPLPDRRIAGSASWRKGSIAFVQDPLRKAEAVLRHVASCTDVVVVTRPGPSGRQRLFSAGFNIVVDFPANLTELRDVVTGIRERGISGPNSERCVYESGEMRFDPMLRRLANVDKVVNLTSKESRVFELLVRHANKTVSREMIDRHNGRPEVSAASRSTDVTVSSIRKKLRSAEIEVEIAAVQSTGYRLVGSWRASRQANRNEASNHEADIGRRKSGFAAE